uniref:Autophagy-related protein n=1 Tax=viral metagenome TaxID=1070528 RepID=A0A6C0BV36_9ZZZZ
MKYIKENKEEYRIKECQKILLKHPDKIPIIVEKNESCQFNDINKNKYLVPEDMPINQFIYIIRKRISLEPSQTLFVMINNKLIPNGKTLGEIYQDGKNTDGFLYMVYTSENTFG